jgi:predicted MFS family arabinose efflux permease
MIVTLTAFIGSLIGGALPSALGTLLGARAESPTAYQAALWVAAVLNLLSLVPFLFVTRAPRHTPRVRVVAPWRAIKNWRVVIQLLIPNAAISLGAGLFIPFLNVIWKERFALPDVTIGLLFGVANLTTVTGMLLAPMLSERLGRVRTTVVAQMLSVPFLLLFGLAPWYPLVVSAFLIRAMLMRMAEPVFYAFEMEQVTASERATFSALGSIVGNLTWGLSAWLSGILQVQSGFGLIFPAVAVLYTVGIACEYLFFGRVPEASTPARVELALSAPAE